MEHNRFPDRLPEMETTFSKQPIDANNKTSNDKKKK